MECAYDVNDGSEDIYDLWSLLLVLAHVPIKVNIVVYAKEGRFGPNGGVERSQKCKDSTGSNHSLGSILDWIFKDFLNMGRKISNNLRIKIFSPFFRVFPPAFRPANLILWYLNTYIHFKYAGNLPDWTIGRLGFVGCLIPSLCVLTSSQHFSTTRNTDRENGSGFNMIGFGQIMPSWSPHGTQFFV